MWENTMAPWSPGMVRNGGDIALDNSDIWCLYVLGVHYRWLQEMFVLCSSNMTT